MEDLWLEVIAFNVALDGTKVCERPTLGVLSRSSKVRLCMLSTYFIQCSGRLILNAVYLSKQVSRMGVELDNEATYENHH